MEFFYLYCEGKCSEKDQSAFKGSIELTDKKAREPETQTKWFFLSYFILLILFHNSPPLTLRVGWEKFQEPKPAFSLIRLLEFLSGNCFFVLVWLDSFPAWAPGAWRESWWYFCANIWPLFPTPAVCSFHPIQQTIRERKLFVGRLVHSISYCDVTEV